MPKKRNRLLPARSEHSGQAEIVCIFGPRGSGKSTFIRSFLSGKSRVVLVDPKGEYDGGTVYTSPLDLYRGIRGARSFLAVYRPPYGDARRAFPYVCEVAHAVKNLWFVVDELPKMVDARRGCPEWEEVIAEGRHAMVRIVASAQRPARVSCDLTENANTLIVFRFHGHRTLKYLSDTIGPELTDRVRGLPAHVHLRWSEDGQISLGKS